MPTYSVRVSGDLADDMEAFIDAYDGSKSDALREFQQPSDRGTYDAAVGELLAIAASEGYWSRSDGSDDDPGIASTNDLDDVEDRVATLEEQVGELRDAVAELREQKEE